MFSSDGNMLRGEVNLNNSLAIGNYFGIKQDLIDELISMETNP